MNWIDPWGQDTYKIDRELGGDEVRNKNNPLSHSYIVITDSNGKVLHTYGWGNTYDDNGKGLWSEDATNDIKAATEGLEKGKSYVEKIGGSDLDPYITKTFEKFKNQSESEKHRWWPWNNCKNEANNLIDTAMEEKDAKGKK